MRTGSGNRSYYNRTTGSRTARLYSKRTAKRINKIYEDGQITRSRDNRYEANGRYNRNYNGRYSEPYYERYDDYYDEPKPKKRRKSGAATAIAAILIIAVLGVIFGALILLRPDRMPSGNVTVEETSETTRDSLATTTVAYEESEPPVIYGVMPIVVYAGHSVSYKQGIYVEDDTDPNPTLEIDNEEVDLSTPGTYVVSYIARDKDKNVTREFTTITVLDGKDLISDEAIYALADRVIDSLITADMTDAMKCLKIYEYLHAINYVDEVHSEDWMQNAYWMLTLREGDCFCYYSAARLLLTRLGYDVMEVRNNNNYVHYWCLVSIDGGNSWWHFDPTCWSWGEDGVLCLVSDNYLSEFTRRHRTSDGRLIHAWDKTNYPATPLNDFWTDEERSVIYEGGLIDLTISYDPDDAMWENNGWDNYPITYYEEPYYDNETYNYEVDYNDYTYTDVEPDSYDYNMEEEYYYQEPDGAAEWGGYEGEYEEGAVEY